MYTTCLFCNSALGANEVVEHFPVGRRLAFDAAKGRLWVVCRKCERWNLTPLEERWEAIEECERQFRSTKLRLSTDNVGLARLTEGLELVRIGAPQRPELAAWRYGDQFGRRRRRYMAMSAAGVAVVGAVVVAGPVAGVVSTGLVTQLPNLFNVANAIYRDRKRVRIALADGARVETSLLLASQARLTPGGDGVELHIKLAPPRGRVRWRAGQDGGSAALFGENAIRAAGAILPVVNRSGGAAGQVREAVKVLEHMRSVDDLYRGVARDAKRNFESGMWQLGESGLLRKLPASLRLALEMAAHEEQERRALEGELAELERMWKEAEEIAAIADDMFVGEGIRGRLRRLKGDGNES